MEVNLPDFAHLVTVFGSTLNSDATSAGVNNTSCSEFTFTTFQITYELNVHLIPYRASIMV